MVPARGRVVMRAEEPRSKATRDYREDTGEVSIPGSAADSLEPADGALQADSPVCAPSDICQEQRSAWLRYQTWELVGFQARKQHFVLGHTTISLAIDG